MNLLTTNHSYISRIAKVPVGKMIRHTGMRSTRQGQRPTRFPQDKGITAIHLGNHQQVVDGWKDVIFGVNDLVEVYK